VVAKTLEHKLSSLRSLNYTAKDFIIADAKDGDMGMGTWAPGYSTDGREKTRKDYLQAMEEMTRSGFVDIMLMSASSAELLTQRGLFEQSPVTAAVRLNDASDIWSARGSNYREHPSQAFASADMATASDHCDLGLYSVTFSNQLEADLASLNAYNLFRKEARQYKMRHFLEVFNPAFDIGIAANDLGHYINDMIIKALAGVNKVDAPQFLKLQFNGRKAMEELSKYDPENLIVGILGGAKGTTRDTFELLHQAEQAGARVALFGRKINLSESPLDLIELMRATIEQSVSPEQAVKDYHSRLADKRIKAERSLEEDLQITDTNLQS